MISIVNYGMGNLGSIQNMLKRINVKSEIVESAEQLQNATKIILPGVGAFDTGIKSLMNSKWIPILNQKILVEKAPILGICLGMQLMTKGSDEGKMPGLGWVEAYTKKFFFPTGSKLKVPHMGWNTAYNKKTSKLIDTSIEEKRFYFVHSYFVDCMDEKDKLLATNYGADFISGFEKENILGVQFHPEKSHRYGMELLFNFANHF